jgi:TolB-like protein/Flp pilus assembly protein TadD
MASGPGAGSPRIDSVAVLPLANLTGDPEQQHFVDAMHDAVIAELAQIRALTVISRQSVLRYRETQKSLPEIAGELGVDAVVQGSVFRAGDTVRTSVQLLQAHPAERHLWAGTFQRSLRDVLALQGEVARGISDQVHVVVRPEELVRLARARPVDPAAYQAWLRGWVELHKLTGPAFAMCIEHANQAVAIDPAYAGAFALAASCHNNLAFFTQTMPEDAIPKAKAAALRAIELDPSLGVAHGALAWALAVYDWDWSGAERAFRAAIELAPGDAISHATYGFFLAWMGRHDEAVAHARRAEELSPGSAPARQNLAVILYLGRRYDEALAQAERAIELAPDFGFAYARVASIHEAKGRYDQAVRAWEDAVRLMGAGDVRMKALLGGAYALAGQREDAQRVLDELLGLARTSYVPPTAIARLYVGLGRIGEAVQWLERGYDVRDGDMVVLKTWPGLDPLRSDQRFQRLMRRMNFPN